LASGQPLYQWVWQTLRPADNQRCVRFLADSEDRWVVRASKRAETLFLESLSRDDFQDAWKNKYPRDMNVFMRGSELYAPDIEEAQRRIEHFRNFNMPSMVTEIENSVDRMKTAAKQNMYLGFHKVCLEDAGYVIAKMHGFELISSDIDGYNIKPKLKSLDEDRLFYRPRLLPYYMVQDVATQGVKDTIDYLEAFPELSGKPAFDHFRVLVPEVATVGSSDEEIIKTNIDLIEKQEIIPLLLGECEGTHYFVCYWM